MLNCILVLYLEKQQAQKKITKHESSILWISKHVTSDNGLFRFGRQVARPESGFFIGMEIPDRRRRYGNLDDARL
jgi:hypothetical protein